MEQSVPSGRQAVQAGGRFHSLEQLDAISTLISQAQGLAYLLGHAGEIECPVPNRVRNAAWGLEDMLERLHELVIDPVPETGSGEEPVSYGGSDEEPPSELHSAPESGSAGYGQEGWRIDPLADWLIDQQPELAKDLIARGPSQARDALTRAMDRRIAAGVGVRHD